MQRRYFIQALLVAMAWPASAWSALWSKTIFQAETLPPIYQDLGLTANTPTQTSIRIVAPEKAENGAVVQVEIHADTNSSFNQVSEINLIAEGNPTPLVARFHLTDQVHPRLVTRIKMAQTSSLHVIVKSVQGLFQQRKAVIVLEDGCAGSDRHEPFTSTMKMRARLQDTGVEVKTIITHPMRTGRNKSDDGKILPAHFMQTLQVSHNGKVVLEMESSTAIAKNPYLTIYLKQGKIGDVIKASWQDNLGYQGEGETSVVV